MKEILMKMVEVAMKAKGLSNSMEEQGYQDNPYWDMYALAADAIYALIGEHTDTFDSSVTYNALNDEELSNEERVNLLLNA